MARGLLIVLEGIDGSGKTTLRAGIAAALAAEGRRVVETKEPTDGPLGRRIRELARSARDAVSPEEELALFHEDRRAHVEAVVGPALARGDVVVQDRSYFSTVAYQGQRGLDRARILAESERIAPRPDVLLVLDLPVEDAERRIGGRGAGRDDFETQLAELRAVFLGLPGAIVLDARRPPEQVLALALEHVRAALAGRA